MRIRHTRHVAIAAVALLASGGAAIGVAQTVAGGFEGFWGPKYRPQTTPTSSARSQETRAETTVLGRIRPAPANTRARLVHWNGIAIDASGVDHTPVAPGEVRTFGEQLGPGRASRAMAIVHIAIFDAVNAIYQDWQSYTGIAEAPPGASVDAAIAHAAHDTLVSLFPSQAAALDEELSKDMALISARGREAGQHLGKRAAAAILADRRKDGSERPEPRLGNEYIASDQPGQWRQDPVSELPVALGAYWGSVRPFVIESGAAFRVPAPPALSSRAYAAAFEEVKRLGGNGSTTPTERTGDQHSAGIYWAYDGMPSLCAPPRLYNQVAMIVADQMGSDFFQLTRLLTLVNVAMADAGIAIWESKYHYKLWRPVTGIREADKDTGPTGLGDGNVATIGDPTFHPLGAPASNLSGPDFTPPFPSYPSGHAGFGGAVFEVLRQFYRTDAIQFTFTSDEYNGVTLGANGQARPNDPRTFTSLSHAEEENGQSRIYLGIHWSFDKTQGIAQGRRVARSVMRNAFGSGSVRF